MRRMMMRKIAIGFVAALLIGGATATAIAGAKYGPLLGLRQQHLR